MESGFFDPVHIPLFQKRLFATSDELKRALRPQGLLSSAVMYASTEGIRRESKDEQCKKTARHFIAFDQKAIGLLQKRKGYKQIVADRCIVKDMNLLLKHRCLLLLPLHVNGNHWVLVCVDIANHKMIYYDSNPPADTEMADVLFKKLSKLIRRATPPHESTASTRPWEKTVLVDPRQANNYDCGLFVMEAMRAFVLGIPFTFSQKDMKRLRLVWLEKLMAHWNATKPKPRETDIKELEDDSDDGDDDRFL